MGGKVSTFNSDIVNSGTISTSVHGIQVGASNISGVNLVSVFAGSITNAGTISAGIDGIRVSHVARFGTSSAGGYIVNSGTIAAGVGIVIDDDSTFLGEVENTALVVCVGFLKPAIAIRNTPLVKGILSGGTEIVGAHGTDAGALISSGGKLLVQSGGTASDVTILSGGIAINAAGATLNVLSGATDSGTLTNSGTVNVIDGGTLTLGAAAVANAGSIRLQGTSGGSGATMLLDANVILGSSSENMTFLSAGNGGLRIANTSGHATAFSGRVSGFGGTAHANKNQFIDLISVTSAAGQITSSYVSANAANTSGKLFVSSGGVQVAAITMVGQYSAGNFHITAGSGGKVEITDPAVPNGGSVAPGPAQHFPQGGIDLPNIAFGARTTLAYAENAAGTGGTLTVSDGRHAASIALFGNYVAGSFVLATDGHGGTLISQVQQTEQPPLLARPHG